MGDDSSGNKDKSFYVPAYLTNSYSNGYTPSYSYSAGSWSTYTELSGKGFAEHFDPKDYVVGDFVIKDGILIKYLGKDETVQIPSDVRIIGYESFRGNKRIKKVIGTHNLEVIAQGAFAFCENLLAIENISNLKGLCKEAFENCSKLKSFTLPKEITSIGEGAFSQCRSLSRFVFNESLEIICCKAFECCIKLKSIELPKSLKKIETAAFAHCITLEKIELPDGLEELQSSVFENCRVLGEVKIGKKLVKIGENDTDKYTSISDFLGGYNSPFIDCHSIKNITISPNNPILQYVAPKLILKKDIKIPCWSYFASSDENSTIIPKGTMVAYCTNEGIIALKNQLEDYIITLSSENKFESIDYGCKLTAIIEISNESLPLEININMFEKTIVYLMRFSYLRKNKKLIEDTENNIKKIGYELKDNPHGFGLILFKESNFVESNLIDDINKNLKLFDENEIKAAIIDLMDKCREHKDD